MIKIKKENWRRCRVGNSLTATIKCPKCGEWIILANKSDGMLHQIINVGEVVPSVHHKECGFHENVRLDGWGTAIARTGRG